MRYSNLIRCIGCIGRTIVMVFSYLIGINLYGIHFSMAIFPIFFMINFRNYIHLKFKTEIFRMASIILKIDKSKVLWQGVIQKPSGQNFALFWPPTYLRGHFLCTKSGQKRQILDHLPTSHCPRGFWMTP